MSKDSLTTAPEFAEAAQGTAVDYENDPVFQAMTFFQELQIQMEECFHSKKTWLPLRFSITEDDNQIVYFEISSDTIVDLERLQKHQSSYEAPGEDGKRLKCAYWEVKSRADERHSLEVARTLHSHAQSQIRVKGDRVNPRPAIGYVTDASSYTTNYSDLAVEFRQTMIRLFTPQQVLKFERYCARLREKETAQDVPAPRTH